jgi:hypothetical protein
MLEPIPENLVYFLIKMLSHSVEIIDATSRCHKLLFACFQQLSNCNILCENKKFTVVKYCYDFKNSRDRTTLSISDDFPIQIIK